jgi:hypothetical protein
VRRPASKSPGTAPAVGGRAADELGAASIAPEPAVGDEARVSALGAARGVVADRASAADTRRPCSSGGALSTATRVRKANATSVNAAPTPSAAPKIQRFPEAVGATTEECPAGASVSTAGGGGGGVATNAPGDAAAGFSAGNERWLGARDAAIS